MTEVAIFFGGVAVGSVAMGWVLVFSDGVSAVGVAFLIAIGCMVLAALCLMIERGLKRLFPGAQIVEVRRLVPTHDRQWWRRAREADNDDDSFVVLREEPPTLPLRRQPDQPVEEPITGRPTMDAWRQG